MEQRLGSEARTSPRSGFLEVPSVVLFLAGEGLNQGAMIADQRGSRRRAQRGPLIVAQEVSSATPQFRYLNVRHFLATFGGFCPTFLPTFWPFGPQICPKSAIDLQKLDFRPHFFVIFASGSVYGLEIALLRRGLELVVAFNFVDA